MAKKVARRAPVTESAKQQEKPAGRGAGGSGGSATAATAAPRWQSTPKRKPLPWGWIAAGVGGVAVILLLAWLASGGNVNLDERVVADEGRAHVDAGEAIVWKNNPPASGTHYPTWSSWTVHTETVEPGYWIHNLEHGGVVLLYKCPDQNCPELAQQIDEIRTGLPSSLRWQTIKFAAVPYEDMDTPFMISAWNTQLPLETLDREKIRAFYSKYLDKGPEDAP